MSSKRFIFVGSVVSLMLVFAAIHPSVIFPQPALADSNILYVASGGDCGGAVPCFSSVQAAVDAAAAGDEIRVASGTYTGVNNLGGLAQMVYITKSLTIRGGYTTSNWTSPDADLNPTELQAQTLGRVVYVAGATTAVTLQGLHLTYGDATGLGGHSPTQLENYPAGGGLYAAESSVTLEHCWLTNNATPSSGFGGGLYIHDGTLNISGTTMNDNQAGHGGAAYLYKNQSQIGANSEFRNNRATVTNGAGAAIAVSGGTFTLSDSTIADNTESIGAPYSGALSIRADQFKVDRVEVSGTLKSNGVSLSGTGTFQDNTVINNAWSGLTIGDGTITARGNVIAYNGAGSTYAGPGVSINGTNNMTVTLEKNHIHHNQTDGAAGGVGIDTAPNGWVTIANNIIEGNSAGKAPIKPGSGGGIGTTGDNVTIRENLIRNNTTFGIDQGIILWGGVAGGIYINDNPTLINNVITGNSAVFKGSGVYINGSAPSLYHNTVAGNSGGTGADATGIYVAEKSSTQRAQPKLWNTIIANQASGIYVKGDVINNIVVADGILWNGNTNNTSGTGTFFLSNEYTGDPFFIDPVNGDYHIGPGSAAIDKGVNTDVLIDMDGEPRIPGQVDLGADEYWGLGVIRFIYLPLVARI